MHPIEAVPSENVSLAATAVAKKEPTDHSVPVVVALGVTFVVVIVILPREGRDDLGK